MVNPLLDQQEHINRRLVLAADEPEGMIDALIRLGNGQTGERDAQRAEARRPVMPPGRQLHHQLATCWRIWSAKACMSGCTISGQPHRLKREGLRQECTETERDT